MSAAPGLAEAASSRPAAPRPAAPKPAAPTQETGTFTDSVAVRWVLVPVIVKADGRYLQDLEQKDFTLRIDGKRVPIASFDTADDAKVSLTYLQDVSGSIGNGGKLKTSRALLSHLARHLRPPDDVAIALFGSGSVRIQLPRTQELSTLSTAAGQWKPWGITALYDAVAWLPDLTPPQPHAKSVAVLVTDGDDNASQISDGEARRLLRQAQLPVYVLGLASGRPLARHRDGRQVHSFDDLLQRLAYETGGSYITVRGPREVPLALEPLLSDLRHQYVLGFRIDGSQGATSSEHTIEVEVKTRSRRKSLSYRRGYLGGPPLLPSR